MVERVTSDTTGSGDRMESDPGGIAARLGHFHARFEAMSAGIPPGCRRHIHRAPVVSLRLTTG